MDGARRVTAVLDSMAAWIHARRYAAAESLGWRALAELGAPGRADSSGLADLIDELLFARGEQSLASSAVSRSLAARAVRAREAAAPRADTLVALAWIHLAQSLRPAGLVDSALACCRRALALQEAAFGPDDIRLAATLNSIGANQRALGDIAAARATLLRALAIRERRLGPESLEVGRLLSNLGLLDVDAGDLASARQHLERSLEIKRRIIGRRAIQAGLTMITLGHLRSMSGDYPEARRLYAESASILADSLGPSRPELLAVRLNLAVLLLKMNEVEEAAGFLDTLSQTMDRLQEPPAELMAQYLDAQAGLARRQGASARAESLYRELLGWQRRANGLRHPEVAKALHGLATTLAERGALAEARDSLELELRISTEIFGSRHPDRARALAALAAVRLRSSAVRQAIPPALEAERVSTEHARLLLQSLPEESGLRLTATRDRGLPIALEALARIASPPESLIARVFDEVIRSRALVLDELASRRRVVTLASDTAALARMDAFARASQMLANLYVRGLGSDSPEDFRERLAQAERQREAAEESLAVMSREARRMRESETIGLAQVRSGLPRGAALVSYVRYPSEASAEDADSSGRFMAFVVRPNRALRRVELGTGIDASAAVWRRAMTRVEGAARDAGAEAHLRRAGIRLRARIWDPIAPLVAGASRIIVVPDGGLHRVSLAALPAGSGRYLIEAVPPLQVISAERDLARRRSAPRRTGLLAMGGADYDGAPVERSRITVTSTSAHAAFRSAPPECAELARARLTPLAETDLEVREVAALWKRASAGGSTLVLSGAEATEGAFKRLAPACRSIHLATHGFFLDRPCAGEGPLLRSGLYLAGANRREHARADEEDGVVTAEEIATLDLSGVSSVVLSACETGVGDVRSDEGVLGLRRVFEAAGVGSLVTSLWPVDDLETRRWMREFYEAQLGGHHSVFESATIASRHRLAVARREGRAGSPLTWAGFIASGRD